LTPQTSKGFSAIYFAEHDLGMTLMPWQKWLLVHALEIDAESRYRFRTIVVVIARQNGKSEMMKILTLWRLLCDNAKMVIGTAQSLDVAEKAWAECCEIVEDSPSLKAEHLKTVLTNGRRSLVFKGNRAYRAIASTPKASRGFTADQVNIDELRTHTNWDAWSAITKTTAARSNGLILGFSNAGDASSVVLNELRANAIASMNSEETDLGLFEWSAPDGCELDDPQGWAQANPSLGYEQGMDVRSIRGALSTDPPNKYRTEVLCQRVDALDNAISVEAWAACTDPQMTLDSLKNRVALCADISLDGLHGSVVAAAKAADGKIHLEVIRDYDGKDVSEAMRADLPGLIAKVKPISLGWFPNGPMARLATFLRSIRQNQELKPSEMPSICQEFTTHVEGRRVIHAGDPLLNAQVAGARPMPRGDGGYVFTRRDAAQIDAVYAAAGALRLAITQKSPGKFSVVTEKSE
jgi:phage terminase large subunit-like protein